MSAPLKSLRTLLWFCACNLLAAAAGAQCSNPAQIPNQTDSSGSYVYTGSAAWSASGVAVDGGASMTVVASNCIQLLPGFNATAGTAATTFHAWVDTLPSAVSVAPSSGSGLTQAFTWTASSPSGYADLSTIYALFNTSISGVGACYIQYDRPANLLFLADNSGNWPSGFVPGSSGSASNSQCAIYGVGSSFSASGMQLALTVSVVFQSSFSGAKNSYVIASNNEGFNTNWQQMGTWTVPSSGQQYSLTTAVSPADAGTISPASGSYASGTVVQVAASAASGYAFSGFSGNLSGTANPQNLTMNGNESVTANFTAVPTITSISPLSGAAGTSVTIVGTGFGGSGTVAFNGTPATSTSWSATQIVAQAPSGGTTGYITVTANGYQAGYYQQQFQVTSVGVAVTPAAVTLGQGAGQQFTATVTGTTNQQVSWSISPSTVGTMSISGFYTAPLTIAAPQTVTVTAASAAQTSATGSATVTLTPPGPTITSLSLPSGPPQLGFVINGANLGATQGSATLTGLAGGNVPLTVISWSSSSITVQVPGSAPQASGQVYVTTSGNVTSNQVPFTVSAPFGCNF